MRGFVISWFFPPINSSEGLVTFKLLKSSGIKHDVFTQNSNNNWSYNNSENYLKHKNITTIFGRAESFDEWTQECFEYFDKNHKKYDFIMSRSMPPESHKAALLIKAKYPNIKWIASFGDPIADSPYTLLSKEKSPHKLDKNSIFNSSIKEVFSPKRLANNLLWDYKDRHFVFEEKTKTRIEKDTISRADHLIFNSSYQENYMLKYFSEQVQNKAIIIPHTYDKDFYINKSKRNRQSDKIEIAYLGHLDYIRSPMNFLKAINKLKRLKSDDYNKLSINFYGNMDNHSKVFILDNSLYDIVHINKPVKYIESLEIMQKSDWCLLIDANLSSVTNENIYFAAKIADYLGSGTNIFGVTMSDGASADIIRETGGIVSSHSVDEIFMYLTLIIDNKVQNNSKDTSKYDSNNATKLYDNIVLKMIAEKNLSHRG